MINRIGIRQGRLSAAGTGPAHHFPWRTWKDEFARAQSCGFDSIEWLFAADGYERNPFWADAGQDDIRRQVAATGIQVDAVCADYFIAHPFFRVSEDARIESAAVLSRLVMRSAGLGVPIVVLPVLEASEIRTEAEKVELLDGLSGPLALAAAHGVRLAIETELPGLACRSLVERCSHPALGVCYDTGNAAARGYDVAADLRTLEPYLHAVHVKDRTRNGPSVRLGYGDADFEGFFSVAEEIGYQGPVIVEAPAGDDPVAAARAHLAFLKQPR